MQYPQGQYGHGAQAQWQPAGEQVLFAEQDVQVTTARFVVGRTTYPLNGITSVREDIKPPSRAWPLCLFLFCFLSLLVGIAGSSGGIIAVALVLGGLGVFTFIRAKAEHKIVITTGAGEQRALTTKDSTLSQRVIGSLNNALARR